MNKKLDRETKEQHIIKIIATNEKSAPNSFLESSTMLLTINVIDINDNPPYFITSTYGSGITDKDAKDKPILTVEVSI